MDANSAGPSPYHLPLDTSSDHTFWLMRQFLDTLYGKRGGFYELGIGQSLHSVHPDGSQLCEVCRRCLNVSPSDNTTITMDVPGGIQGLQATACKCAMCFFLLEKISALTLDRIRRIKLSRHVPKVQTTEDFPLMDILLEVTWRMERSHLLAFCPDFNAASDRAIWGTRWPVNLVMRAPLLRTWLQNCREHHSHCSKVLMSQRPTRLLYINNSATGTQVRLVTFSDDSSFPEYVALSHCWGTNFQPLSTISGNIEEFQKAIEVSELTTTFRDAVAITQSLELSYLWCDSLCIIQDSLEDWQTESAKMGSIYENASITIAASSAEDSSGGCFLEIEEVATQRIEASLPKDSESLHGSLRSAKADPFAIHTSPLSKRGWVLQENILSRRMIHFTKHQMYWQCRELAESEDGFLKETRLPDDNKKASRVMLYPNTTVTENLSRLWWMWAMDYSRRLFTVTADRLYACAGITQYFSQLSGKPGAAVLGLRREQLQRDLLWTVVNQSSAPRIRAAGLPSWTWLSRNATLADEEDHLHWHPFEPVAEIVSINLVWEGKELASPLRKAEIHIRGRSATMRVGDQLPSTGIPSWNGTHALVSDHGDPTQYVEFSAIFDDDPPKRGSSVFCLEMLRSTRPDEGDRMATSDGRTPISRLLLLRLVEGTGSHFERIGIGAIVCNTWAPSYVASTERSFAEMTFEKADPLMFTLV